jgi:hypothetical protein
MLLPATAFAASDGKKDDKKSSTEKKDDTKKDDKKKDEKKPVLIVTWDFDWVPIFRAAE